MAANEESHLEGSPSLGSSMVGDGRDDGGTLETLSSSSFFQCCICLDILYKPVVLACGHISCFWCVHKAMHQLRTSYCPICRQPYSHFPNICELLHFLLLKIEPVEYKRREKEVLEEEQEHELFSPQFRELCALERVHPGEIDENHKPNGDLASEEVSLLGNGVFHKKVCADDVLCIICKELLYHPAVLNCGHVYCESCLSSLAGEPLKCQVCHRMHPGELPNICLYLDHFLEEQFPSKYRMRRERLLREKMEGPCGNPSSSGSRKEKKNGESSFKMKDGHIPFDEDFGNTHVGVGCDSCGKYPIIGKRYKCQDCEEKIGYDLCEDCYNTNSKLPGRFNQQHTPDHRFELDESQMLRRIFAHSSLVQHIPDHFSMDDDSDDHENSDTAPYVRENEN